MQCYGIFLLVYLNQKYQNLLVIILFYTSLNIHITHKQKYCHPSHRRQVKPVFTRDTTTNGFFHSESSVISLFNENFYDEKRNSMKMMCKFYRFKKTQTIHIIKDYFSKSSTLHELYNLQLYVYSNLFCLRSLISKWSTFPVYNETRLTQLGLAQCKIWHKLHLITENIYFCGR